MSAYVCFAQDRECGDMERSWCDTCPKRKVAPECSNSPELRGIKSAYAAPLPAAPAPTEQARQVEKLSMSMVDSRDYLKGWNDCIDAIGAARQAPDSRDAWPEEPTPEMQAAGAQAIRFDTTIINKMWTANAVYRAMRAALGKAK